MDTSNILILQKNKFLEGYYQQRSSLWYETEINLTDDLNILDTLSEEEIKLLAYTLIFFQEADNIIIKNINTNFSSNNFNINKDSIEAWYIIQNFIELIHRLTYEKLVHTFYIKNKRFHDIYDNIHLEVKDKLEFINELVNSENLNNTILNFIAVEGLFFTGSFAIFNYFKDKRMTGIGTSNELISKDENLHTIIGIEIYKTLDNINPEEVINVFNKFINIEENSINNLFNTIIKKDNVGYITPKSLVDRIKFVADNYLETMGLERYYKVSNPYKNMFKMNYSIRTNFLEMQNTSYINCEDSIDINHLESL